MRVGRILRWTIVASVLPVFGEDWSPRLAAEYLDGRQKEWFGWKAAKAPGGPCISCHTGVTYLLARPALRKALGEPERTAYETGLLDALRARVDKTEAKDVFPSFTKEPVASQALGVEAIHSAFLLSFNAPWSTDTQRAFDRLWSLQVREGTSKGAWAWFDLDLDPWETADSRFYGASLAALAIGGAPSAYRGRTEIKDNVAALIAYLQREQNGQPLQNRLMLLWVSARVQGALEPDKRQSLLDEAWRAQQTDGGWTLASLGHWKERPAAPHSEGSDSYATGLVAFLVQRGGVARTDARLTRALNWLRSHQDRRSGSWAAESMNKRYEAGSMMASFQRDAATSFAVLAMLPE